MGGRRPISLHDGYSSFFLILVWGFPIVAAGILFDVDHLAELSAENFADEVLGSGQKDGYDISAAANGSIGFSVLATPTVPGTTGERAFYGDETGVIRYTVDGTAPDSTSPALGGRVSP